MKTTALLLWTLAAVLLLLAAGAVYADVLITTGGTKFEGKVSFDKDTQTYTVQTANGGKMKFPADVVKEVRKGEVLPPKPPMPTPSAGKLKASPTGTVVPVTPTAAPVVPPALLPIKELTLDLGGAVTMKLILIRPGKFMMGEVDPQEVTLTKPFYMGATPVTQAQYEAVMGANPSFNKGAANPVDTVVWDDAVEFCKKLSAKTSQAVRLPTEAEWEYACRAGTQTAFSFGDDESASGDYAWHNGNSGGTTHPVGQKKPNPWGLCDMHGNVWQWCADWFGDYPKQAATDPQGPASGTARVLRGGSWNYAPHDCRSATRGSNSPEGRFVDFGFRVVVTATDQNLP